MKTRILGKYILTMLVSISLLACSDSFLDEKNPNKGTAFWETEADAVAAVATIYSPVRGQMYGYWGAYTGFQDQSVRGDDLHPINDDPQTWQITIFTNTPNTERIGVEGGDSDGDWEALYRSINRSNQLLTNIDKVPMDETKKDQLKGEAYFLRAWNYFMLVINWGGVPIRLLPIETDEEAMAPVSPEADVWAQIESDLKEAKAKLPATRPASENGRVTKDAATAYLGRAYVYQEKYAEAKIELGEIRNSGKYGLMENPDDNYTEENEFNKESIFEINYYPHGTGGTWANDDSNTPQINVLANFVGSPLTGGWYKLQASKFIVDEFTKEERPEGSDSRWDKRMYTNFFFKYSDYSDAKTDAKWYGTREVTFDQLWESTSAKRIGNDPKYSSIDGVPGRFIIKKWTAFWSGNGDSMDNTQKHTNNVRVMRYAEVLLLLAEAATKTGDNNLANECLKEIRDRAGLAVKSFSGMDELMAEIEHQRLLEFFLEGHRFYDLKRWYNYTQIKDIFEKNGKVGASTKRVDIAPVSFQEKHIYFPIPQTEIETNLDAEQHPLWR